MKYRRHDKWVKRILQIGMLCVLCVISGVYNTSKATERSNTGDTDTYDKLKIFSEVLYLLTTNYIEEVDVTSAIYGAIHGMVGALDPHSSFMTPDLYQEIQEEPRRNLGGLGIQITIKDNQLTIIAPIDETPAYHAGIHAGDRIIKIDGQSTEKMRMMEAVRLLRGPKGTSVTITIMRDSFENPKDFTITRGIIQLKSIIFKMLDDNIGYIRLGQFQENSSDELEHGLNELKQQGMKSLILDLRNNPGGLLNAAVEVADKFLEKGDLIVYTEGRMKNQNMRFVAREDTAYTSYPLIVLVNGGSAGASEIVAGALQDHERTVILGTSTYGKGSVQSVIPLSDNSGLRLTTAKYYTPKGHVIDDNGIQPDIVVAQPEIEGMIKFGELMSDIQLQRAMSILKFRGVY